MRLNSPPLTVKATCFCAAAQLVLNHPREGGDARDRQRGVAGRGAVADRAEAGAANQGYSRQRLVVARQVEGRVRPDAPKANAAPVARPLLTSSPAVPAWSWRLA